MRSISAGGNETWTWKAGGSWEPGWGLKIRGNYSKAVRAPNIGELFTPLTVGLTNLGIDPCAGNAPLRRSDLAAPSVSRKARRRDRPDHQPDGGPGQRGVRRQHQPEAGNGQDLDARRGVRAGVPAEVLDVDRLLQHPHQGRYRLGASGRCDQRLLRQSRQPAPPTRTA